MAEAKNDDETTGTGPETEADAPEAAPAAAGEEDPQALREKWLRARADLDNLRKRVNQQVAKSVRMERQTILSALLEVVDSLDSGLQAHRDEETETVEGLRALRRQMLEVLKRFGAEPFESTGEPFDPRRHEAVARIPVPGQPDGVIVEVMGQGYALEDGTLLRPARVVVSGSG